MKKHANKPARGFWDWWYGGGGDGGGSSKG
jgi:hypothetical protein